MGYLCKRLEWSSKGSTFCVRMKTANPFVLWYWLLDVKFQKFLGGQTSIWTKKFRILKNTYIFFSFRPQHLWQVYLNLFDAFFVFVDNLQTHLLICKLRSTVFCKFEPLTPIFFSNVANILNRTWSIVCDFFYHFGTFGWSSTLLWFLSGYSFYRLWLFTLDLEKCPVFEL